MDEDATLGAELNRRGRQFQELVDEITDIEAKMALPSFYEGDWQPTMERYQELQALMARSGGGDVAGHAQEILKALDLAHHPMETKLSSLSGGEKAKVALARQLVGLKEIDLLFLDEPTNHLDAESVLWLEQHLSEYKGTVIAITHDRYFLDNVAGWILELDRGEGIPWKGNYSSWLEQKTKRLAQEEKTESKRRRTLERELEWERMSPKGRRTKSKSRLSNYEKLLGNEGRQKEEKIELYNIFILNLFI